MENINYIGSVTGQSVTLTEDIRQSLYPDNIVCSRCERTYPVHCLSRSDDDEIVCNSCLAIWTIGNIDQSQLSDIQAENPGESDPEQSAGCWDYSSDLSFLTCDLFQEPLEYVFAFNR